MHIPQDTALLLSQRFLCCVHLLLLPTTRCCLCCLFMLHCRRHDALWRAQALRTLPALMAASDMLICGEDLGFVPACLPPVMQVKCRLDNSI
jgi:hypothetical protein